MEVVRVSMFPVGDNWTVLVEYKNHVESRKFLGRANAEWYKEIMEGRIRKPQCN